MPYLYHTDKERKEMLDRLFEAADKLPAVIPITYVRETVKRLGAEVKEIDTEGELDLQGFLGIDPSIRPGYDEIRYTVRIKGDGTPEQFREIHETVMRTSPNRFNLANPIRLTAELVVE